MKKRQGLTIPQASASELSESNDEALRDLIRHEQPTATRDLSVLRAHPHPSRLLEPKHVVDMAFSISALGLIHPIVIDIRDVVIAGSHRFAALKLLSRRAAERRDFLAALCGEEALLRGATITSGLEALSPPSEQAQVNFGAIPVRIMPFSIADNPQGAWQIEVAENERRRDYSKEEIKQVAERLSARGYRFERGRPKVGEPLALPVLAALVGKSERTLRRLLMADQPKRKTIEQSSLVTNSAIDASDLAPRGGDFERDRAAAHETLQRFVKAHEALLDATTSKVILDAVALLEAWVVP